MSRPARGPKLRLGIDGKADATKRRRATLGSGRDRTEALS
jgi:hypothetical protein